MPAHQVLGDFIVSSIVSLTAENNSQLTVQCANNRPSMKTPRRLAPIAALLARIAETSWARAAQSALLGQTPVLAAGTAMFATYC
jgi:hypothetical protein